MALGISHQIGSVCGNAKVSYPETPSETFPDDRPEVGRIVVCGSSQWKPSAAINCSIQRQKIDYDIGSPIQMASPPLSPCASSPHGDDWWRRPCQAQPGPMGSIRPDLSVVCKAFETQAQATTDLQNLEAYTEKEHGLPLSTSRKNGGGGVPVFVPASGFSFSTREIWKIIRQNKDLDLPAHKVMVATVRCEEIANEKFAQLTSDGAWHVLEETVQSGPIKGFGRILSSILEKYFSDYELEAAHFDDSVRTAKRQQLELKSLDLVYPCYQAMLEHICSEALTNFKYELELARKNGEAFGVAVWHCTKASMEEFDLGCADAYVQQATWDTSKHQEKLCCDIDAHVASLRVVNLSDIKALFENRLNEVLCEPVASLLTTASVDTWPTIRKMLTRETKAIISEFSSSIVEFEIDEEIVGKMVESLKDYGRSLIEKKAREEAGKVLLHMKDRFSIVFSHRTKSMSRFWTGKEGVRAITKDARLASLKLLAIMAALRLDEKPDKIESTLSYALLDAVGVKGAVRGRRISSAVNSLASSTWEGISPSNTLITPVKCTSLWRQFMSETEYIVGQAQVAQEARIRSASWLPSIWVIVALTFLGFNEFMIVLRNPLYLLVLFSLFLLFKALCMQLDILGLLRRGILSGITSLQSKCAPVVTNILRRSGGAEQKHASSAESDNVVLSSLSSEDGSFKQVSTQDAPSVSASSENSCIDSFEQ